VYYLVINKIGAEHNHQGLVGEWTRNSRHAAGKRGETL